jgi:translation initiation factor 3 subunit C
VNGGVNEPVDEYTTVGKGGKVMQFTSEGIFKHLQAVQEARGKKVYFKSSCPSYYSFT